MSEFEEIKVENLRFSSILFLFFILFLFPRSVYPRTPLARQPKISALNPFAPGSVLIKNLPRIQFSPYFLRFCFDFPKFLMRQPLTVFLFQLCLNEAACFILLKIGFTAYCFYSSFSISSVWYTSFVASPSVAVILIVISVSPIGMESKSNVNKPPSISRYSLSVSYSIFTSP